MKAIYTLAILGVAVNGPIETDSSRPRTFAPGGEIIPAACDRLAAVRCEQEAKQCHEACRTGSDTLASRCRNDCQWKLNACMATARCR